MIDLGRSPKQCPKCAGTMEAGFLRDRQQGRFSKAAEWVQGDPDMSLFGNVKTSSKTRYRIKAFRCEKCGYLEQYAVGLPLSDWG